MIYETTDGKKILALSDEDLVELGWEPKQLLELDHDGVGWTIRQAMCHTARYLPDEN